MTEQNSRPFCCRQIRLRLCSVVFIIGFALTAFTLNELATPLSKIATYIGPTTVPKQALLFTAVGFKGCTNFVLNHKVLSRLEKQLEDSPTVDIRVKSVEIPTKEEFVVWLNLRHNAEQVPPYHMTSPVNFKTSGQDMEFVGGVDELIQYVQKTYPEVELSDLKKALVNWRLNEKNKNQPTEPVQESAKPEETEPEVAEPVEENNQVETIPTPVEEVTNPIPSLEAQVNPRNKIVSAYRSAEGKTVTNHRPLWQVLTKERQWKFLWNAPAMASWIFVQDQTSANLAALKNKRAIVNNIGWGGQSCYGGTKGAQMRCRMELAARDGCSYDSLNVQPTQYRFWIQEECNQFFSACTQEDAKDKLWIEKPSGGQHGVGMKVHRGCAKLKSRWGSCSASFARSKKWFVMEYIDPALLDGHKFDLRTYLLVASLNPVLVFYHDGFVRKAGNLYSSDVKDAKAHITNSMEQDGGEDHFWDFDRLEKHLHEKLGFPNDYLSVHFRKHAMKVSNFVFQAARSNMYKRKGSYQLFAVDWIIDSGGGIHMLECNSNPLVFNYPIPGYPETWQSMVDLLWKIHVSPSELQAPLITKPNNFHFDGWHLVFNQLEETQLGWTYNACKALTGLKQSGGVLVDRNISEIEAEIAGESEDEGDIAEEQMQLTPLEALDTAMKSRSRTPIDLLGSKFQCALITDIHGDNKITRCSLLNDANMESYFYVIDALEQADQGPVVAVIGGVHGNEHAGIVAARHVRRHWRPARGRLLVIERANVVGVERGSRITPNASPNQKDLNRNFPDDLSEPPQGETATAIWEVLSLFKPEVFFDLHEGWGVYKQLKDNPHEKLVGNKAFSKGSSVISSSRAVPIANFMLDSVNEEIKLESKKFLLIVPPVKNGLANRVSKAFDSLAIVLETTSGNQKLELRVHQQLLMLSTALKTINVLPKDFDLTEDPPLESCVAGRKQCALGHPGDELVIKEMLMTA